MVMRQPNLVAERFDSGTPGQRLSIDNKAKSGVACRQWFGLVGFMSFLLL
jgi:hypothetical protein